MWSYIENIFIWKMREKLFIAVFMMIIIICAIHVSTLHHIRICILFFFYEFTIPQCWIFLELKKWGIAGMEKRVLNYYCFHINIQ